MDPQDHLIQRPDGSGCAVCGEPVPPDSIRLLAQRDDLAFVQVACRCGSTTLAFVMAPGASEASTDGDPALGAVTADDVLDMHALLSGWRGGIRELLETPPTRPGEAG